MGLLLNGNAPNKILYNGVEVSLYFNGSKIWPDGSPTPPTPDPYNPLNLPANTVRVRTSDGNAPIKGTGLFAATYEIATLVAGTIDVYDVYKSGTSFKRFLYGSTNVVEILGANTTGITEMGSMFYNCSALTSVPLFNTSNVTSMESMFYNCSALTSVPLFNTSSVTNMNTMFYGCSSLTSIPLFDTSKVYDIRYTFMYCYNVQTGALALYNQASTQANPPGNYSNAFRFCGSNTTTGAAELAQIPTSWGGTMS